MLLAGVSYDQEDDGVSYSTGILLTTKTDAGWSKPKELSFEKKLEWSNPSATVSPNGKVMFLNNSGDIFISFKKNDTLWSAPRKLSISTESDEFTPTLSPDGKFLFFASDGYPTLGRHDIFIMKRLDDTWLRWTKPQNLGPKFNTDGFNNYFSIRPQGDYAITYIMEVTYEESSGNGDLYQTVLPY
jgi:hypothetical protein